MAPVIIPWSMRMPETSPLLAVTDARVTYRRGGRVNHAVRGVDFVLGEGEILGLVGESGCGKSSLARALAGLEPLSGGDIQFCGTSVTGLAGRHRRDYGRLVQMVFQDPSGSLNPRMTLAQTLGEVLTVHGIVSRAGAPAGVAALLERVELPAGLASRYPHELSGGQRQRVGLARALALSPRVILADEPVSALDVSVQVQILNLMRELRDREGIAFLFIAHDLAAVNYLCDRTLVMYAGRMVEEARGQDLWRAPAHPYTALLRASIPEMARRSALPPPSGPPSHGAAPLSGAGTAGLHHCPFQPRCPRATRACCESEPALASVGPGRRSACFFAMEQLQDTLDDG